MVKALSDARTRCDDLEGDFQSERTSRQQFQNDIRDLETKLRTLQTSVNKSAFALVLIDADHDGYTFSDDYITRGADGGQSAARELQKDVQTQLNARGVDENVSVVVRAFANTEAVSKVLGESGIHDPKIKMARFVQGFNRVKFCDFVSVGSGKDRADEKIKGNTKKKAINENMLMSQQHFSSVLVSTQPVFTWSSVLVMTTVM